MGHTGRSQVGLELKAGGDFFKKKGTISIKLFSRNIQVAGESINRSYKK